MKFKFLSGVTKECTRKNWAKIYLIFLNIFKGFLYFKKNKFKNFKCKECTRKKWVKNFLYY